MMHSIKDRVEQGEVMILYSLITMILFSLILALLAHLEPKIAAHFNKVQTAIAKPYP